LKRRKERKKKQSKNISPTPKQMVKNISVWRFVSF